MKKSDKTVNEFGFVIKGKELDLRPALPLTVKDWKELEKRSVGLSDMINPSISTLSILSHYVISKVDSEITQDDIDALRLQEISRIPELMGKAEESVDVPFSKRST